MKIRFDPTFYQYFECSQRRFALLHRIQDSGERNDLSIQCAFTNTNSIYCDIRTMLKFMFIEIAYTRAAHNLANSFIPFGL